jgi:hypothetical protein
MNRRMPNGTSGGVGAGDRQRSPATRFDHYPIFGFAKGAFEELGDIVAPVALNGGRAKAS